MPTGIYKRTENNLRGIRNFNKTKIGKKRPEFSDEWKKKEKRLNINFGEKQSIKCLILLVKNVIKTIIEYMERRTIHKSN